MCIYKKFKNHTVFRPNSRDAKCKKLKKERNRQGHQTAPKPLANYHTSHLFLLFCTASAAYFNIYITQISLSLSLSPEAKFKPNLLLKSNFFTLSMAQKLATLMVLLFAMAVGHSSATWCVCKPGLSETVLQKSIDYACGNGADCTLIHQGGGCFNPNTVPGHCNYAVNSYFQRKGQASGSCDFAGAAAISTSDPSTPGCVYPSSASSATTTNTPKSSSGTVTPVGGSPYTATPSNGVLGGVNSLGPSGVGINTDDSAAGLTLKQSTTRIFTGIVFLGNIFLWG